MAAASSGRGTSSKSWENCFHRTCAYVPGSRGSASPAPYRAQMALIVGVERFLCQTCGAPYQQLVHT